MDSIATLKNRLLYYCFEEVKNSPPKIETKVLGSTQIAQSSGEMLETVTIAFQGSP